MMTMEQLEEDYHRVEQAIRFIEGEALRQPSLGDIAAAAGLSEFHFQRLFSRWVGISPKRFLQFLTKEYARTLLEESRDVLSVTLDSGLSSPGRLHELFVSHPGRCRIAFEVVQDDGSEATIDAGSAVQADPALVERVREICGSDAIAVVQ